MCLALVAVPSAGAALPGGYTASSPTENPSPSSTTDHFGANMVNAGDVTGDGIDDLLVGVPDSSGGLPGVTGKIVYVNGATGAPVGQPIRPPNGDTLLSHAGAPTAFGAQVATIGDLNGNGVPEHVVSAPGSDLSSTAVDMGIVYVYDGATSNILKRLELAADDQPVLLSRLRQGAHLGRRRARVPGLRRDRAVPLPPELAGRARRPRRRGQERHRDRRPRLHGERRERDEPERLSDHRPRDVPGAWTHLRLQRRGHHRRPGYAARRPGFDGSVPRSGDRRPAASPGSVPGPDRRRRVVRIRRGELRPDDLELPRDHSAGPVQAPRPDGYPDFLASAPGLSSGDVTRAGKTFVVEGRHALLVAALDSPDPQQDSGFGPPPVTRPRPATSVPRRFPTSISRRPARISPPAPTRAAAMR